MHHQCCNVNFRTGKQVPQAFQLDQQTNKQLHGRPHRLVQKRAFLKAAKYIEENDDEQITITDLVQKMTEFCSDSKDAYSTVYMKAKLKEHFGFSLVVTEIYGKRNVVTLRKTASSILHEFYQRPKHQDLKMEEKSIIDTAAKLIKSDIKCFKVNLPSTFRHIII